MRVWSFRVSFKKLAVVSVILTAIVFAAICTVILKSVRESDLDGRTAESRAAFLQSRGLTVDMTAETVTEVTIPACFDQVYESYNQIQLRQGFDLWHYAGMRAKLYSCPVTNTPNSGKDIRANLLTYDGKIIGGDLFDGEKSGLLVGINQISLNLGEIQNYLP